MSTDCFCGSGQKSLLRSTVRGGKSRNVVRCKRCGAVRLGAADENDRQAFHELGQQSDEIDLDPLSDEYEERNLIDVRRRVNSLLGELDGSERLLDFGTGMGHFLAEIDPYVDDAVGSEINRQRLEFVREELGYDVYEGTDAVLEAFGEGSLDVITMFHVLEHLTDPVEQLERVGELLAEDGVLFIEVPNHADWLLDRSAAYADFYYQEAHAYYFTSETLNLALVMAGFGSDIAGVQRYGPRNAAHWLLNGEPQLSDPDRNRDTWSEPASKLYAGLLAAVGRTDTLWATCRKF